jgi:hypothetical protein
MLNLLAGSKPTDAEYQRFIRETQFDYTKDLDAIAGSAQDGQVFFVLRGRFEWSRLRQYASGHGGECQDATCRIPAMKSGRWMSFKAIQPDVMCLALSGDPLAVNSFHREARPSPMAMPANPVWVHVSPSLLKSPLALPIPLRIFAISLQPANSVLLSLGPADQNDGAVFKVILDAYCPSQATAETIRNQMEIQTKMLKLELKREHQTPNPADFTGLLTAGTFQVIKNRLEATWPVRKELLNTLE